MAAIGRFAGLDRKAFNPGLAGIAAWLVASGKEPSTDDLERLLSSHFPQRAAPGFVAKFLAVEASAVLPRVPSTMERDALLEQAFLEAKSDLRHLVVATSPQGGFTDDAGFERNAVYVSASREIDAIELDLTSLDEFDLSRCPHCQTVGHLALWFGLRRVGGRPIPQAWCRVCRSLRS